MTFLPSFRVNSRKAPPGFRRYMASFSLDIAMQPLRSAGTQMLAEIHENYTIQLKMAAKGYWV